MDLCLAIPYYANASPLFYRCVNELIRQPPTGIGMVDIIGDSLIPRGRNTLAWKFLHETDCKWMLFVDSDILFTPGHVSRIISHDLEKYPCIGGLYPKKKPGVHWVLNTYEGDPTTAREDGLLKVKYAGTGFMLLTRKVMEEIAERWPDRNYVADNDEPGDYRYDYFPIGPRNRILPECPEVDPGKERYLSEDWAICELINALGYEVQVDTEIRLEHRGDINFPIKVEDVLPAEALQDLEIGRRTREYLSKVEVFTSKSSNTEAERRLMDFDSFTGYLNPRTNDPSQ